MEKPFVTVSIITYNSSKTIKDTLNSILNQSYPYLELTISDDGSTDDTVSICRCWTNQHKGRFARIQILTASYNTGVTANLNRAWTACKTKWNKDIAGDDILLPNCIENYVSYIDDNPDAIVVFSRLKPFETKSGKRVWLNDSWHNYDFFKLCPDDQLHYLIYCAGHIPTCTAFYNIPELLGINFKHDERIPLLEDDPKWIVLVKKGIKFHFLDKVTVGYRCSSESLAHGISSPKYYKSRLLFYLYYYLEEIKSADDRDSIYNLICKEALRTYTKTYNEAIELRKSGSYRLGRFFSFPIHAIKRIIDSLIR